MCRPSTAANIRRYFDNITGKIRKRPLLYTSFWKQSERAYMVPQLGAVFGPLHSPEWTTCDFYLWGRLKHRLYKINPHSLEKLSNNRRRKISTISGQELQTASSVLRSCIFWQEVNIFSICCSTGEFFLNKFLTIPPNSHAFYSGMTTRFGLTRPSSGQHYKKKNSKIRCNAVQIKLLIWDPIWHRSYIKLYKYRWIGNVLAGDCVQAVYKNVKYTHKNY